MVFYEQTYLGDLLKYEEENLYSRDAITVAAGQNLKLGAVLGMLGGKAVALDPAATDGSEIAVGLLIRDTDATTHEVEAVMVSRNATVSDLYVVWPAAITIPQMNTAIAQLQQLGVVIRKGA